MYYGIRYAVSPLRKRSMVTAAKFPRQSLYGGGCELWDLIGICWAPVRRRLALLAAATLLVSLSSPVFASASGSTSTLPVFTHIFIIVMENHEYSEIIGSSSAPYTNSLATQNALATRYDAVSHPSLPNYLSLTAASTFGITSDCENCFLNQTNLADQIEASGRTWRAYMESMPSPCSLIDAPAQRRAISSSDLPSFGNVGVPVFPAIQSMSRQVFASNTCSQARRAVPARWLYESPLMMIAAASGETLFGSGGARLQSL